MRLVEQAPWGLARDLKMDAVEHKNGDFTQHPFIRCPPLAIFSHAVKFIMHDLLLVIRPFRRRPGPQSYRQPGRIAVPPTWGWSSKSCEVFLNKTSLSRISSGCQISWPLPGGRKAILRKLIGGLRMLKMGRRASMANRLEIHSSRGARPGADFR